MEFERDLHLPPKAKLTWYISRLQLDASNTVWIATGHKQNRVAVIRLPPLEPLSCAEPLAQAEQTSQTQAARDAREEEWIAQIESAFEARAFDPVQDSLPSEYLCP